MTTETPETTEPSAPLSKKKQRKLIIKSAFGLLDNELQEHYPLCFNRKALKPLKIGIYDDIRAEHPELDEKALKMALAIHCGSKDYLATLTEGNKRINATGDEIEPISEAGAIHAKERLKAIADKGERDKQRKIAHKARLKVEREKRDEKAAEKAKAEAKAEGEKLKEVIPKTDKTPKVTSNKPVIVTKKPEVATKKPPTITTKKRPTLSFLRDK